MLYYHNGHTNKIAGNLGRRLAVEIAAGNRERSLGVLGVIVSLGRLFMETNPVFDEHRYTEIVFDHLTDKLEEMGAIDLDFVETLKFQEVTPL